MTEQNSSSRRTFLKGGAVIAAPLVAVAAPAAAMVAPAATPRTSRREDEAALHALHRDWLRHVNRGDHREAAQLFLNPRKAGLDETLNAVAADHMGDADLIEVSADGQRATGRFDCLVETVSTLEPDNTLAQMAHLQGTATVRHTARKQVKANYVRASDGWKIAKIDIA